MYDDGAATEQQMDDINGKIKVIKKQVKATLSQRDNVYSELKIIDTRLDEINNNIDDCFIINPIDGKVLTKYANKSEFVAMGKPIYKVSDVSEMHLRVYVSGGQLHELIIGQKVEVLIDKGMEDYTKMQGIISWISDEAEFTPKIIQTKKERVNLVYAAKVRVKNDGSIKAGMPGEIRISN